MHINMNPHHDLDFLSPGYLVLHTILGVASLALFVWLIWYVYSDARSRGLNPVVWALVVAFLQNPVGPIIYLIVRSMNKRQSCPYCGQPAEKGFSHCSQCGRTLQAACPHCQKPIAADWQVCAHCGTSLQGVERPALAAMEREVNDFKLNYVIAAMVLIAIFDALGGNLFKIRLFNVHL